MSDHSTKKYPAAPSEISELLGFNKPSVDHGAHPVETHSSAATGPEHLPVVDSGHGHPSDGHADAHKDIEHEVVREVSENTSAWKKVLKTTLPYVGVFIVGLGLYYFFLGKTDISSVLDKMKSTEQTVQTPKETALESLQKNSMAEYNKWIAQYYFEVTDSSITDPKADNSGNGLSNFHKFLLNLNPRSYDTLGLGMADSEALAQGLNPLTGSKLNDKQKSVIDKYFDMEVIMNRLTLNHRQGNVAGTRTQIQLRDSQATTPVLAPILTYGVSARGPLSAATGNSVVVNNPAPINPVVLPSGNRQDELDIDTTKPGILSIPSLNLTAPIIFSTKPENLDKDLQSGVVHYPGTALPGQVGTTYISGHSSNYAWAKGSYNRVFSKLGSLADNTSFSITVTLKDGKTAKLHYVVTRRAEYKATDQEQFKNAGVPTVALSTCWPINTTQKRLVVFGEQTQIER